MWSYTHLRCVLCSPCVSLPVDGSYNVWLMESWLWCSRSRSLMVARLHRSDLQCYIDAGSGRRAQTFTDLLYEVHDVPGIDRIRFATSHPRYFTERLIRACAELPKMCEFFHIPFQSGDNDILREVRALQRDQPPKTSSGVALHEGPVMS